VIGHEFGEFAATEENQFIKAAERNMLHVHQAVGCSTMAQQHFANEPLTAFHSLHMQFHAGS